MICLARPATAQMLSQSGIRLESQAFGNFTAWPGISSQLAEQPAILFIATKAPALEEALERAPAAQVAGSLIVPLLNGVEHMDLLRKRYGQGIVAASIGNVEVKQIAPGHVRHTTRSALIHLASGQGVSQAAVENVASQLRAIGLEAKIGTSEAEVIWTKLVRLNALACTTAASGQPVAIVRTDPAWRKLLIACVEEGCQVADAEGCHFSPAVVVAQLDALPATMSTSMERDVSSGRPSEIDAIAGAIVRVGRKHNIECPTIAAQIETIQRRTRSLNAHA